MLLDATASEAAKTAGMQLALTFSGAWQDEVIAELAGWLATEKARGTRTCTIEQFRAQCKTRPTSPNAWGSLPRMAAKAGLIARAVDSAGEPIYRKAAAPKTHAHPVGVYRIL